MKQNKKICENCKYLTRETHQGRGIEHLFCSFWREFFYTGFQMKNFSDNCSKFIKDEYKEWGD